MLFEFIESTILNVTFVRIVRNISEMLANRLCITSMNNYLWVKCSTIKKIPLLNHLASIAQCLYASFRKLPLMTLWKEHFFSKIFGCLFFYKLVDSLYLNKLKWIFKYILSRAVHLQKLSALKLMTLYHNAISCFCAVSFTLKLKQRAYNISLSTWMNMCQVIKPISHALKLHNLVDI